MGGGNQSINQVRARMAQKKIIFVQLSAEGAKASQKIFDEIFKPR